MKRDEEKEQENGELHPQELNRFVIEVLGTEKAMRAFHAGQTDLSKFKSYDPDDHRRSNLEKADDIIERVRLECQEARTEERAEQCNAALRLMGAHFAEKCLGIFIDNETAKLLSDKLMTNNREALAIARKLMGIGMMMVVTWRMIQP